MEIVLELFGKIGNIDSKNIKLKINEKIAILNDLKEKHEKVYNFYNINYYIFKIISLVTILGTTVSFLSLVPYFIPSILASIGFLSMLILLLFQFERKTNPHKIAIDKLNSLIIELNIFNEVIDNKKKNLNLTREFKVYIFKSARIISDLPNVPKLFRNEKENKRIIHSNTRMAYLIPDDIKIEQDEPIQ